MNPEGRPKSILLAGYYGFQNAGDEAVLAGLLKAFRLRQNDAALRLTAHSIDPKATAAQHGVDSAHRYRPIDLIRSLAGTDLFALGGGSLLQDATSARSIFYYLAVVRVAQIMGKKTMFVAQGIGPLNLPKSRRLTRGVANRLDAITVRDKASADLLTAIGVTRPPITVTADPALLLTQHSPAGLRAGCAVSLREWRDRTDGLVTQLAAAYRSKLPAAEVSAMSMHAEADEVVNRRFVAAVGGNLRPDAAFPENRLDHLIDIAAMSEMVIGMRLHALIFAAAAATPAVAISYDPKVAAFMAQAGQADSVFDLESSPDSLLGELIERTWSDRASRCDALMERLPALRAAAQRNADVALEVLGTRP